MVTNGTYFCLFKITKIAFVIFVFPGVFIIALNRLSFMFKLQLKTNRKLKTKPSHHISGQSIAGAYTKVVEGPCAHLHFVGP